MADACLALRCCDLNVCLGQVRVVHGVTFDCCQGKWVVIGGAGAAGRTALLRAIDGLCPPGGGRIWALGPWVPDRTPPEARRVGRQARTVFQEIALFDTLTARASVELGVRGRGFAKEVARRRAEERFHRLGLEQKLDEMPMRRSGHRRERVALARELMPRPRPLILDEPTSPLERSAARIVMEAVRRLLEAGATVVMPAPDADVGRPCRACHLELVAEGRPSGQCS
jgi:ABC-type polar amino acid transport system ATPase subunit